MTSMKEQLDEDQRLYDSIVELAHEHAGDLDLAVILATLSEQAGLENGRGCDGCDRFMVGDILDAAGFTFSEARDANGDPEISICPVCQQEAQEERQGPTQLEII